GDGPLALGGRQVVAELDEDVLRVDHRRAELVAQPAAGELDLGVLIDHDGELGRVADRGRVHPDARLREAEERGQRVLRGAAGRGERGDIVAGTPTYRPDHHQVVVVIELQAESGAAPKTAAEHGTYSLRSVPMRTPCAQVVVQTA